MKKNVVVFGGGNGTAIALEALKFVAGDFDISGIIAMSDSGGSSGLLRQEFKTVPPGDILRAMLALSKYDYKLLRQVFYKTRFDNVGDKLNKHNLGNLFLILAGQRQQDFALAVRALEQSLETVGHVYPATLIPNDLCAQLSNGEIIKTESEIDTPTYDRSLRVKKVWLEPAVSAYPGAIEVIKKADYIILSPGSLYTSVVASLLPSGIKEAIDNNHQAKIIYVAGSAYRTAGETGPTKLSEFVGELEQYLPRPIDLTIYSKHRLNKFQEKIYAEKKWAAFEQDADKLPADRVYGKNFQEKNGGLCSKKLSKILKKILK